MIAKIGPTAKTMRICHAEKCAMHVADAAGAIASSFETASRGVLYEHQAASPTGEALRRERDLSVNWLADFSGLGRGHLSRLLRGKSNASLRTLAALANALDVPLSSLMDIEEPERPGPKAVRRTKSKKEKRRP